MGLQILWAVLLLVGTYFLPESPRFLIEKGQNEKAYKTLQRFRKKNDEEYLKKEFKQMLDQINWEKENEEKSIVGILKKTSYRKRLILACGIQIGQQICGISAINYYQTIMYRSLGIEGMLSPKAVAFASY